MLSFVLLFLLKNCSKLSNTGTVVAADTLTLTEWFQYICAGKIDHQADIDDDNNNDSYSARVTVS